MPINENILQAITHTFLHSLWQGIPAALLAGLVLLLTKRSRASLRYKLLGAVLLLFLAGTGITFWLEMQSPAPDAAMPPAPTVVSGIVYAAAPQPDLLNRCMQFIDGHTSQIMMVWTLIFFLKCIRMGAGFYHIFRIRHSNTIEPSGEWARKLRQLALSLGIRTPVKLLESARVQMPFTIGWLKPCIYVPAGLLAQLPADQLEAILLHELAHIRRRDYLVNILQRFAETIFFFNPALLWISACIREEREACCDDIAVAHTPRQASYLQALVAFEDAGQRQMELGMAFGQKKFYLLERVKRILTNENKKLTVMEKGILLLGLAGITAFSFVPAKEQPAASPTVLEIKADIPKDTTVKPFKAEKVKKDSVILRNKIKKVNKDSVKAYRLNSKDSAHVIYFDTVAGQKIYKAYTKAYQQQDTQLAKKVYALMLSDTTRFKTHTTYSMVVSDTAYFKTTKAQKSYRDSVYKIAYHRPQKMDSTYAIAYKLATTKGNLSRLNSDSLMVLKKKLDKKDSLIKILKLELESAEKQLKEERKKIEKKSLKGSNAYLNEKEIKETAEIQLARAMQTEIKYSVSGGIYMARPIKLSTYSDKQASKPKPAPSLRKKNSDNIKEQPANEKWHAPKHYKPTFRENAVKALPLQLQEKLLPPVPDGC